MSLRALAAVLATASGAGAGAYWLVGDVSNGGGDHAFGPYHVGATILLTVGVLALVAGVAGGVALVRWAGQGRLTGGWVGLALGLAVGAVLSAGAWRAATAGVAGVNIGAGLLLFGAVMWWMLILVAALIGLWRRGRAPRKLPTTPALTDGL